MTDDFCVISKSETGAPGTSAPGKNGCKYSTPGQSICAFDLCDIVNILTENYSARQCSTCLYSQYRRLIGTQASVTAAETSSRVQPQQARSRWLTTSPGTSIVVSVYVRTEHKACTDSIDFAACLTMNVDEIDTSVYTHIHFAFANVTRGDFKVEITDPKVLEQFELFKGMTDVKKIISLGGWAFSTEPGTFSILREAAKPVRNASVRTACEAYADFVHLPSG